MWRWLFAGSVFALDVLAVFEVAGPAGPRTAAGVLTLSGVLMLTLPGFVLWLSALDRVERAHRMGISVSEWPGWALCAAAGRRGKFVRRRAAS